MRQINGFWLPDHELHLIPFLERGPRFAHGPTYQIHKFQACIPHIKDFRVALDVGAHCGLWSRPMAALFDNVQAFEPVTEHRACFTRNMAWFEIRNVTLRATALGDHAGNVTLHTSPTSSGDTFVQAGGEHASPIEMLDSYGLEFVDFIKIDCEGFEKFVIAGGEETIKRCKPCMIVEQKPGKAVQFGLGDTEAIVLLKKWGAEQVKEISGDFIMRWR